MSKEHPDITKMTLVCDHSGCGWTQDTAPEDASEWHKKPCPKCENGEIIDDDDLAQLNMVLCLSLFQQAIDPEGKLERGSLKLDTATNSVEIKG